VEFLIERGFLESAAFYHSKLFFENKQENAFFILA